MRRFSTSLHNVDEAIHLVTVTLIGRRCEHWNCPPNAEDEDTLESKTATIRVQNFRVVDQTFCQRLHTNTGAKVKRAVNFSYRHRCPIEDLEKATGNLGRPCYIGLPSEG